MNVNDIYLEFVSMEFHKLVMKPKHKKWQGLEYGHQN